MTASPRERLLAAASDLVRQHGVAGTGLAALLAESGTARGSIYQHFPEGKDELIEAATDIAGEVLRTAAWSSTSAATAEDVVRQVVERARQTLRAEKYSRGCPVVAAAVAGPEHERVVQAAGRAFRSWTKDLAAALREVGVPAETARSRKTTTPRTRSARRSTRSPPCSSSNMRWRSCGSRAASSRRP